MDENEKKLFYFEMEKKLLKSEKELRTAVEDELKKRYKWVGTIIAVIVAFLGTGSYVLIVKTQLSDTASSLEAMSTTALKRLEVAEEVQEYAGKRMNRAVEESQKLIDNTYKLTEELNSKLSLVKQDITSEKFKVENLLNEIDTILNTMDLMSKRSISLRQAVKRTASNKSNIESAESFDNTIRDSLERVKSGLNRSQLTIAIDENIEIENDDFSSIIEKLEKLGYLLIQISTIHEPSSPYTITLGCGDDVPVEYVQEIISTLRKGESKLKYIKDLNKEDIIGRVEKRDIVIRLTEDPDKEEHRFPTKEQWSELANLKDQKFFDFIKSFKKLSIK